MKTVFGMLDVYDNMDDVKPQDLDAFMPDTVYTTRKRAQHEAELDHEDRWRLEHNGQLDLFPTPPLEWINQSDGWWSALGSYDAHEVTYYTYAIAVEEDDDEDV